MSTDKHVLIIGANFSNKGAEAMMKTVKQQLERNFGQVSCYMVCRPYEQYLAAQAGFVPVFRQQPPPIVGKLRSFEYRAKGKLYKLIHGRNRPWYFPFPFAEIAKIMGRLDAVIDVSGFAYADSWGKPMIDETTKLVEWCKRESVMFYFLPQAWGSFEQAEVAGAIKRMLATADGFYARDEVSRRHIAKALGTDVSEISVFPDIAFTFNGGNGAAPASKPTYKRADRLLIGISPNLRVYEKLPGKEADNSYVQLLLDVCRYCLTDLDAEIVLIPNETFPDTTDHIDDRFLCNLLYEQLGRPAQCHVVTGYASAEEIKSYIGEVDALISSRFHALIFALLQHKPVLAISWSHKYRELFGLFGLEEFVNESNSIQDHQAVLKQVGKLVSERGEFEARITANLPILQSKIDALFEDILV